MHSITKHKNTKSNIFVQNKQVSIPPGILQESFRNARNSWVILGVSIFFEQVSIPPGIHQESSRNARNSWVILGFSIYFLNKCQFLQDSSRIPPGMPGIPG
jgi:hypothetical protein